MSRKKPSRRDLLPLAAELGPEDGIDPRLPVRQPWQKGPNRKALQLCGQVARTLTGALAESGEEILRDLVVVSVTPAPSSVRLLVTVAPSRSAREIDVGQTLERLQQALPHLRTEVAASVSRRRVPELTFRMMT